MFEKIRYVRDCDNALVMPSMLLPEYEDWYYLTSQYIIEFPALIKSRTYFFKQKHSTTEERVVHYDKNQGQKPG